MKYFFAILAMLLAVSPAAAAPGVEVINVVQVERMVVVDGHVRIVLTQAELVVPGDKINVSIQYRNGGAKPVSDFVITNPVPAGVQYVGDATPVATVSVDGGHSWGDLAALKIRSADGSARTAQPADVTHLRWVLNGAIAPGASGKVSFRGVVR